MKISIVAATALLLAGTSMAQAAWDQDQTITDLQSQGFTHIEIVVGTTQAKVEASNATTKVETVFDLVTGDVVKTETEAVRPGDEQTPGVEVRTSNREAFVEDHHGNEQGDDHGSASGGHGGDDGQADDNDHQGSDDTGSDDHSGSGGGDGGGDDSGHDGGGDDSDHGGGHDD